MKVCPRKGRRCSAFSPILIISGLLQRKDCRKDDAFYYALFTQIAFDINIQIDVLLPREKVIFKDRIYRFHAMSSA